MLSRIPRERIMALLLGVAGMLAISSSARALTKVTACGQTLGKTGQYVLAADLDCSGTLASGLTISASNVTLHLAGHTLSSADCDHTKNITGIAINSGITGVQVEGGTVKGFNDGISLYSANSRVSSMTITNACIFGIAVSGTNNQVDTSVVTLSGLDGIGIGAATGTKILSNDISGNTRVGVDISNFSANSLVQNNIINHNGLIAGEQGGVAIFNGTGNVISNNTVNNNFNGIEVESAGNVISNNRVAGSVSTGIFVVGVGVPATVQMNKVLGSGVVDLSDDSATCAGGADIWKGNTFQTDLAGAASDGGPGQGCIR